MLRIIITKKIPINSVNSRDDGVNVSKSRFKISF